ncbi:MAG: S8 family serine peptidase, partial [Phycisphaerales bacterium]|nr:S8 family serine peptidase [Phycisphaerales bacterium]
MIVGVIDTGCRRTHEDLAAHMWVNDDPPNGLDDDGNGFVDDTFGWNFAGGNSNTDDVYGHGTQASGIIGAGLDNGVGVAGLANVTLLTAKWWHQSGSDCSVAESVYYAVDNGASVLNLSLSCGCLMPMTEAAVDYAHANDVVIVCSAGNGGSDSPHYPAAYAPAMAVSAIDINGQHPSFSSYGAHVDVAAPSPDIITCDEDGDALYDPGFRGTSAAAPHVAGLAALVRSVNPSLTNDAVRDAINANATDVGAPGFDDLFGHG